MEQPQTIPPYRAHDGESYPRPDGATTEHIPVWHRFIDEPTGEIAEHISHWIVDPGPFGYLSQTQPLDDEGNDIGDERVRCFGCGADPFMIEMSIYRRSPEGVVYIRVQDDPEWDVSNRTATPTG